MDARWAILAARAVDFGSKLTEKGVRPYRTLSAGRQGGHVGIYLASTIDAALAREHILAAMAESNLMDGDRNAADGEVRLFPKHKNGPITVVAPGTPVALPFWGGATALTSDWSDAQDQNGCVPMPELTPETCLLALPPGNQQSGPT